MSEWQGQHFLDLILKAGGSPVLHPPGSALCAVQVRFRPILLMLQLVRGGAELYLWEAFMTAGDGGKGWVGASALHLCHPMANEWQGQLSYTHALGACLPIPSPLGPALFCCPGKAQGPQH